jgi:hypothetical protein
MHLVQRKYLLYRTQTKVVLRDNLSTECIHHMRPNNRVTMFITTSSSNLPFSLSLSLSLSLPYPCDFIWFDLLRFNHA